MTTPVKIHYLPDVIFVPIDHASKNLVFSGGIQGTEIFLHIDIAVNIRVSFEIISDL